MPIEQSEVLLEGVVAVRRLHVQIVVVAVVPGDPAGGKRERKENGVISGYPLLDIKVTVIDGSYH